MNSHMHCKLRSLVEPGSALGAAERFFVAIFSMGAHMIPDVALERFSADIAFVQSLVLVKGQNMPFEGVSPWISFVA